MKEERENMAATRGAWGGFRGGRGGFWGDKWGRGEYRGRGDHWGNSRGQKFWGREGFKG